MDTCITCRHIRLTEHQDEETGHGETYTTFWCSLRRMIIYLPREQTCTMQEDKQK